jgi:hypothetical protein
VGSSPTLAFFCFFFAHISTSMNIQNSALCFLLILSLGLVSFECGYGVLIYRLESMVSDGSIFPLVATELSNARNPHFEIGVPYIAHGFPLTLTEVIYS